MIRVSNPKTQYLAHREEIIAAIEATLDGGQYILGDQVRTFETAFASYCGTAHAIGVGCGTDALVIALQALGIGPGDEVVTVSHTFAATALAIELTGATPVFVDIEPDHHTMDPVRIEAALGPKTKAILPVHLYGHPADMEAIANIAGRHGLRIVEDCAQAVGADIDGRKAGAWGDIGCFSFYPTKNLGALGDGGMTVTNDSDLANRMASLRQYGFDDAEESRYAGRNSRLDEIQAAVLNVKLKYLDRENERRRDIAGKYSALLSESGLRLPRERVGARHVFHHYAVAVEGRADLIRHLNAQGIEPGVHYPVPVHRQPWFLDRHGDLDLPETNKAAGQILSLPIYPELDDRDVETVAQAIRGWEEGR